MKNKKWKIIILSLSTAFVVLFMAVIFPWVFQDEGEENTYSWNKEQTFDILDEKYNSNIYVDSAENFKILNFSDIQLGDFSSESDVVSVYSTIKKSIEETSPNLITLTGDLVSFLYYKNTAEKIINYIDGFNIKWAPINGNHDCGGNLSSNKIGDLYLKAKNCIYKKGANNIGGVGNYLVNVFEGKNLFKSLVMMDTNSFGTTNLLGVPYGGLSEKQSKWYEWAINGLNEYNNEVVETLLFAHVPIKEYEDAYFYWEDNNFDATLGFGDKEKRVSYGDSDSVFYQKIVELKSTKYIFSGHDHLNTFSVLYNGIRFTYCLKTGYGNYNSENKNGGTVIEFKNDSVGVYHKYIKL